ncbi:MAG TPA: CbiX/SirB N-terminal domain-containing protein [Streptosporangiaceae bacterium]|jgi:sirohydrochlorin ferrochelatase|nr:CbiX/SirB N-terminal domain-containing protein [Streptosporangiaceae bacterium]
MSRPTLLAVAHGSKDPAAKVTITALAREVTRFAPVLKVRVAFIQHAEPSLDDELSAAGENAVIVPLLLSTGYHLATDIAGAASAAGARVAGPLGPDTLLVTALAGRLAEAGVPDGTPVVLAAAGSTDPAAQRDAERQAELLAERLEVPVTAAFLSAAGPRVDEAVAELAARENREVAIASYLLAPGHFQDQLAGAGARWVTAPLGGHPAMAGLVIDRYRTASRAPLPALAIPA